MNGHRAYQRSAVDRPLVVRGRTDVQREAVQFASQTTYVLKDPLTLELFHLSAEEFFLFDNLKAAISLKQLQQAFQKRFAPRTITPDQLQQGVNQLHSQGLLLSDAAGQGGELRERDQRRRSAQRWQSLLKVLSFRLGSFDATGLIDSLHCRVRWVFSLPVLAAMVLLVGFALSIAIGQADEVYARLPSLSELSQPRYWLMWLSTIALVKILHELAHAITCKHFGGRCHEMGVLMLAMIPCLYCDVSDIWRLRSKWQRIAVSAAGMIAELSIASIALLAWWYSQPGVLNVWCLSVVVVCSVGTLLVNANPLLRYDGYYMLSDLVEVPNLSGRAQSLLPNALRRWLLGERPAEEPLLTEQQRHGLLLYTLAARVYLTLVLISIFVVLLTWARPYRLENLVYTLAVMTLGGMLFAPLRGVWKMWRNPSHRYRVRPVRLAALLGIVGAGVVACFCWPVTDSVRGPVVLVAAEGSPVYAAKGGQLEFVLPAGSEVRKGEVIARLQDADAELEFSQQQGTYEVSLVRQQQLSMMRSWDEHAAQQLPTATAATHDAKMQLTQLQDKLKELTIRAPRDGVIVAPPKVERETEGESRLTTWAGSPLKERNLGCWIEPGTLIAQVADSQQLEALVMIDQSDVEAVQVGQTVKLQLDGVPLSILTGEVVQVGQRSTQRQAVESAVDPGRYHLVQVRLDAHQRSLLIGSRGTAKIKSRRNTLSTIVGNELRQLFRLPW